MPIITFPVHVLCQLCKVIAILFQATAVNWICSQVEIHLPSCQWKSDYRECWELQICATFQHVCLGYEITL